MKLVLGVIDYPYVDEGGVTTGDVADYIERRYGLLQAFIREKGDKVSDAVAKRITGDLDRIYNGQAPTDLTTAKFDDIAAMMRDFVTTGEAERCGIPGTPTGAAKRRRSLRFKKKKSGGPRPSFDDTGAMVDSYAAWISP